MKSVCPAGTCPHVVDGSKGLMRRKRAMRAALILIVLASQSATAVRAEPRVLWQMKFDVSLIPEVQPLLRQQILKAPIILEELAEAPRSAHGPNALMAGELVEAGSEVRKTVLGKVTPWHLMRKPVLNPPPGRVKNEVFGLVKTMPQAYAGMMFGVGWLLLLVSAGLGYLGRKVDPYSSDDPATWNSDAPRPLAPLLIDADELRTAGAYPDRRL